MDEGLYNTIIECFKKAIDLGEEELSNSVSNSVFRPILECFCSKWLRDNYSTVSYEECIIRYLTDLFEDDGDYTHLYECFGMVLKNLYHEKVNKLIEQEGKYFGSYCFDRSGIESQKERWAIVHQCLAFVYEGIRGCFDNDELNILYKANSKAYSDLGSNYQRVQFYFLSWWDKIRKSLIMFESPVLASAYLSRRIINIIDDVLRGVPEGAERDVSLIKEVLYQLSLKNFFDINTKIPSFTRNYPKTGLGFSQNDKNLPFILAMLDLTEDGCKDFTKNDCETIIGLSYDRMVFLSRFLEPALSKLYTSCHCMLSYGRMGADKGVGYPIRHEEIRNILLVSEDANIKSIRAFLYFFLLKINDIENNVDKDKITTLLPLHNVDKITALLPLR